MRPLRDSDWLCSPGEYQNAISELSSSDPRLRAREPKNIAQRIEFHNKGAKLVVLEGGPGDNSFGRPAEHTPEALRTYLKYNHHHGPDSRRLFILEGLHPDYIAVLGDYFMMHPSMFIDQERTSVMTAHTTEESDIFTLPGTTRTSQHYTIKYFELVGLPKEAQGSFRMSCALTGRHVGVTRTMGKFMELGVVRRKCTVWRQAHPSGNGWDCIILTDPPLKLINKTYNGSFHTDIIHITPHPYQQGYRDFIPHSIQLSTLLPGPPRTSMLDDLVFYLLHHTSHLTQQSTPHYTPEIFAKKIVASHYAQLYTYIWSLVSNIQWHMSRKALPEMDLIDSAYVQSGQWSDDQALERRVAEYCADLEGLMLVCGIPLQDSPDVSGTSPYHTLTTRTGTTHSHHQHQQPDWEDPTADFQVLRLRLADVRRRAELLNTTISGLASMSGNHQSLREARSTKALTLVGLVFIPLAYTAALFSMAEPFGPGAEKFWVYFAVSVPLILLVLGTYAVMDAYEVRNQGGRGGFSVRRFVRALGPAR